MYIRGGPIIVVLVRRIAVRILIVVALMTTGCTESEPSAVATAAEATTDHGTVTQAEGSTSSPATTTAGSSTTGAVNPLPAEVFEVVSFPAPAGSRPHDVAPADDGGVWYTAQRFGALGHLNPETGETRHIPLGNGSAPNGVIVGPNGLVWVTDSGLNAIVSVDPSISATGQNDEVTVYPLPADAPNINPTPQLSPVTAACGSRVRTASTGCWIQYRARSKCSLRRAVEVPMASQRPPRVISITPRWRQLRRFG